MSTVDSRNERPRKRPTRWSKDERIQEAPSGKEKTDGLPELNEEEYDEQWEHEWEDIDDLETNNHAHQNQKPYYNYSRRGRGRGRGQVRGRRGQGAYNKFNYLGRHEAVQSPGFRPRSETLYDTEEDEHMDMPPGVEMTNLKVKIQDGKRFAEPEEGSDVGYAEERRSQSSFSSRYTRGRGSRGYSSARGSRGVWNARGTVGRQSYSNEEDVVDCREVLNRRKRLHSDAAECDLREKLQRRDDCGDLRNILDSKDSSAMDLRDIIEPPPDFTLIDEYRAEESPSYVEREGNELLNRSVTPDQDAFDAGSRNYEEERHDDADRGADFGRKSVEMDRRSEEKWQQRFSEKHELRRSEIVQHSEQVDRRERQSFEHRSGFQRDSWEEERGSPDQLRDEAWRSYSPEQWKSPTWNQDTNWNVGVNYEGRGRERDREDRIKRQGSSRDSVIEQDREYELVRERAAKFGREMFGEMRAGKGRSPSEERSGGVERGRILQMDIEMGIGPRQWSRERSQSMDSKTNRSFRDHSLSIERERLSQQGDRDVRPVWEEVRGFLHERGRSPSRERIRSPPRNRVRTPPRDRVRSPPRDRVRSPPRDRVRSPPRDRIRSPPRDRVRSPPRDRVRSPPRDRVRSPPRDRVRSPPRERPRSSSRERIRSPLRDRIRSPPRERVRSPPRQRLRSPLRERVRTPPGERVRSPPRERVRSPPRDRVRSPPRERMRSPPRELVKNPPREQMRSPPRDRVRSPPRERMRSPPREHVKIPPPREQIRSPPRERSRNPPPRDQIRSPPRERVRSPARERVRSPPRARVRSPPRDRLRSPRRDQVRSPPRDRTISNSVERDHSGGQERRSHEEKGRAQDQLRNANREVERGKGRETVMEKSPERNRMRSQERSRDSFQQVPRNFGREATQVLDRDKVRKRNIVESAVKERPRERARSPILPSPREKLSNQNISNNSFFIKEDNRRFPRENNKDKFNKKDDLKGDRRLTINEVKRESINDQNVSQEWEKIRDFQERRNCPPAGLPFLEDSRKKFETSRDDRSGDRGPREQKLPFLDDKNSPPLNNDPGRSWLSQSSRHADRSHSPWSSPVKRERDRRALGAARDENNPHKSSSYHVPHSTNNPQSAANGNDGECWQRRPYTSSADTHWDKPRSDFDTGKTLHPKALQSPNQVVFVRGLARDITDMDIRKDISECRLWPKDVRVVIDADSGVSRGLAFITFNSVDEARRWMELREGVLNLRQNNHAPMDYSNPTSRDWECIRCHTMNFRHRTACHLCGRVKEDCLDGWEETSPYPTNALLLRGISSSTNNSEVIKTLKSRVEGSSRLDSVQMGKDANGRPRPICFVQLTSVVDSIALHKSLSSDPLFLDGQHALVSYCQLDKLPSIMEPCGPPVNLQPHTRLPATLPPSLSSGLALNLPCGTPSPNIPLVTRTPVPSALKGLGVSTQVIRSMLEGNYTEKDIPILAQYCAQAYAKNPQERAAYVNYYTKHYKDRLLKSVASKMMKLS